MGVRDRRILVAVALVGLLAVVAVCVERDRSRRTARSLRAEAAEAERGGKFEQAERALARYLAIRPDDADAFAAHTALLERLAKTTEDWLKVSNDYERVVRSDPRRREVRRRLAEIGLALGRFGDAENHLAVLCETSADDSALEILRGRCCEGRGAFPAAAAWYEKAREHDPNRLDGSIRLATLLRDKFADTERANLVVDEMVGSNPGSSQAWFLRARYRGLFHLPGKDSDLAKALELAPDDPEVAIERARSLRESGEFDRAQGLLVRVQQAHPDDPRTYAELAEVGVNSGRVGEAIAQLRRGVERQPDQAELRWSLAHLLAQTGSTAELAGHLERLRGSRRPSTPIAYLEAWLFVNQGDWASASRALERVGASCEDRPELRARVDYLKGRCLGQAGESDLQIAAFRRAFLVQPRWALVRRALASALLRQGETDEAESLYRRDVEDGGGSPLSLNNLAWLWAIRGDDAAGALALINRAIALAGRKPDLLDTRGVVYTALGRPDLALSDLNESVAASSSSLTCLHIALANLTENDRPAVSAAVRRAEAAGLDPGRLHPLERAAYDRLLAAVARP